VGAKRASFPTLARLALQGFPIPGFRENTELIKNLIKYATESLNRYKKLVEENPDKPFPTLFTRLFKGEEDESLTFKEIVDAAQTYIVAGTDTTAITLTYTVWRVCQNPSIQKRLVDELAQLPDGFGDHDALKLPYLNQVIEEALRLHSAAPSGLPRVVPPEGATLAGQYLPGGSIVCTQAWSLHRNADVYPDPERFDPDRWAAPTKAMKDAFMPFGGGSRGKSGGEPWHQRDFIETMC
jgi:cytochrome P450